MYWRGKNAAAHAVSLLAIFAMLAVFCQSVDESLSRALSASDGADGLSQLMYCFPDQDMEPAILNKTDDSGSSSIQVSIQRFFALFGPITSGNAFLVSRHKPHSTGNSIDGKGVILIKLRI